MKSFVHRLGTLPYALDRWLWQKKLGHPLVMPIVRNEILCALAGLGLGLLLAPITLWLFWFGFGFAILALTFFTLAHFFLHIRLDAYSSALFMRVLFRWCGRLLVTALLLYIALVLCAAPVSAILAGLVAASVVALVTYAIHAQRT